MGDVCGSAGVAYQCSGGTEYHMTKKCYDEAKAKVKIAWKKWLETHPEDKKSKKDDKDDDGEDEGEGEEASKSEAESEAKSGHTSGQEGGKSNKSGDAADEDEGSANETDKKGED